MNLTGTWKGFFVYGPEYGEAIHHEKVQFIIYLVSANDTFEGTCVDIEGIDTNFEKATIKGFVENGFISFVKQYPYLMSFDETGKAINDESKPQPEIHYSGEFNPRKKSFSGNWQMVSHSEQFGNEWLEEDDTGTWEMEFDTEN